MKNIGKIHPLASGCQSLAKAHSVHVRFAIGWMVPAQRLYRVSLARERVIAETFHSLLDLPIELPAGLQAHFEVFGFFSDDMPFFDAKVA